METITTYVVQAWVNGYEYWSNTAELPDSMFALPRMGYDTEEQGRARLSELRAASPSTRYRLIRHIATSEEI